MNPIFLVFDDQGDDQRRIRAGLRFLLFIIAYLALLYLFLSALQITVAVISHLTGSFVIFLNTGYAALVIQGLLLLVTALFANWICARFIEAIPLRATGWSLHKGWLHNFGLGSLIGIGSLLLALIISSARGVTLSLPSGVAMLVSVASTLLFTALVFIIAAAAEEYTFRGYALQTLMRSWPIWFAALPSALLFAFVHQNNPNGGSPLPFFNTALAGIWLTLGFYRTRSLWLPLGIHFGWNWAQGSIFGLPISGVTVFASTPLMHVRPNGPGWLTGGNYGLEGGAACTIAVLISTLFILRMTFSAAEQNFINREKPGST